MVFRVGPYIYRVRISEGPIVLPTGESATGLADRDRRQILIAYDVPPEQRMNVLLHELKHCWLFHVAAPRSEEEGCEFYAFVTEQMMSDLRDAGGPEALEKLRVPTPYGHDDPPHKIQMTGEGEALLVTPLQYTQPHETRARPSGLRAQCGQCGITIVGGAIITDPATKDEDAGGMVCRRHLFCPHCEHIQTWVEGSLHGRPNGAVVDGPFYERGSAVGEFLSAHGEAVGMVVV